ncbi:hypothetical protein NliqN6_0446 [Naganishia liquefaciens]|uniref:Zn(2)-C6 fungal-type domain-containing protein n=1 Tax=Naganishia liquefaciens TaxID=104408 RepID=A0A8H3TND8_9TREE|nr:hypothetical protein NliqN6_0446 [Naganishia liquefaciens]
MSRTGENTFKDPQETNTSHIVEVDDAAFSRKRRKTQRACDRCRDKKLRCEFPGTDEGSICIPCAQAKASCETLLPAKMDKRKLRKLLSEHKLPRSDCQNEAPFNAFYFPADERYTPEHPTLRSVSFATAWRDLDWIQTPGGIDRHRLQNALCRTTASTRPLNASISATGHDSLDYGFRQNSSNSRDRSQAGAASGDPYVPPGQYPEHGSIDLYPPPLPDHHERIGSDSQTHTVSPSHFGHQANPGRDSLSRISASLLLEHNSRPLDQSPPLLRSAQRSHSRAPLKIVGIEPRLLGATAVTSLLNEISNEDVVAEHDSRFGLFRLTDDYLYSANPEGLVHKENVLYRKQVSAEVINKLALMYAAKVAPICPIVLPENARRHETLPRPLLFAIASVAALSREVPHSLFLEVRNTLDRLIIEHDVLTCSTLINIKTILVLSMSHELHGGTNSEGGSVAWLRSATAIRMSQDIGLHRLSPSHWSPAMLEERHLVWLACIIMDSWYSAVYGQPQMRNPLDEDDPLLNSAYITDHEGIYTYQKHFYHVSCLLGRVAQAVYRPNAMRRMTDLELQEILRDIDDNIASLPAHLRYFGLDTPTQGGLILLAIVAIEILFFRNFVRRNKDVPDHITFKPSSSRWGETVSRSRQAIQWMACKGSIVLDCWPLVGKYGLTYAALVQYYHYLHEQDSQALEMLDMAKTVMKNWAVGGEYDDLRGQDTRSPSPLPFRAKVADIVNLLWESATATAASLQNPDSALNS